MQAALWGKPADRLPAIEWADWWQETRRQWESQGVPGELGRNEMFDLWGLDHHDQLWLRHWGEGFPAPAYHGSGVMKDEADYERLKPLMYRPEAIDRALKWVREIQPAYRRGETTFWLTLEGFFWYPRTLLGIERHLYAFYDQPALLHKINRDHAGYCMAFLEALYAIETPEFMTFAEDMSYNHGPMLSKDCYKAFVKPYYQQLIPYIKSKGTKVLIDTDGDVEPLIPWFLEAGIDGVLPLERQAGVDVNRIRQAYPEWIMLGGYDKTIMHLGEEAMKKEFERLLPAMCAGRYIPTVDHQTPPDVSAENYGIYVRLLKEYGQRAASAFGK